MKGKSENSDKYLINARWSLGFGKKYFFVFLVGRDKRLEKIPQIDDRRQHSNIGKAIVYTGILAWVLAGTFVLSFTVAYIVKSRLGIDLVKGRSPFPEFLKKIGVCH